MPSKISILLIVFFISGQRPPGKGGYQGIYIDKFQQIIGDTAQENSLLRWCLKYEFNALSLYGVRAVLSTPRLRPSLSAFIRRAKTQYHIRQVTAIVEHSATVTGLIDDYNKEQADPLNRIDFTNLELEWWNNASSFDQYVQAMQEMKSWGGRQHPPVPNEEYIGWFKNPVGEDSIMAAALVQNSTRILLHDYQKEPGFSYIMNRLDWIGRAAKAQGKVMPVIIIFSPKPEFSYAYFSAHSFGDAYQLILDSYDQTDFQGKNNVQLIGFQIYNQTFARQTKP
jgi:hypothetical protein